MNRIAFVLVFAGLFSFSCQSPESHDEEPEVAPVKWVNPFIGTGGHGHTYPGATMPFGMVQLSPDTRLEGWDGCSGYHSTDSIIYGFSHTHLSGTGISDYGDVLLMPTTRKGWLKSGYNISPDSGYASRFEKHTEAAEPGYYSVQLTDESISTEFTVTERCGIHKYRFPERENRFLTVDLEHRDMLLDGGMKIVSPTEIEGFRISKAWADEQHIYFVARFSEPIKDSLFTERKVNGHLQKTVAAFGFGPGRAPLLVKVGISPVSIEGARNNLGTEIPDFDFEAVRMKANETWNTALSKINVKGGTDEQKHIFYTALYHAMIAPNLYSDADGKYRGMDKEIHSLKDDKQYTVFSLWDTFRATHPLYTIIEQDRTNAFIRTFIRQYQEGGKIPIWELSGNYTGCMIGYHSIPVIADAYLKGIRDWDAKQALAAMIHSAMEDELGLEFYKKNGFIGAGEEAESVSKTLEYAYDDWCISAMARAMGDEKTWSLFTKRAQSYKNLFDPESGFFRAKMNGGWQRGFDPSEVNFNFTEANAWQYSLFVPQDIPGLIRMHGGAENFGAHLDKLFTVSSATTGREQADITGLIGQYAHGNEPSHHMAYLYAYIDQHSKTQLRVRQIMDEMYHNEPDGLSGNEDCGQMSAWFVFSAMGFYPVCPGSNQYIIGSPLFRETTIHLENGKEFTIKAREISDSNRYIQGAELNGKALHRTFITHEEIMEGGILNFEMGPSPNDKWAGESPEKPGPEISELPIVPVPFFKTGSQTFTDSLVVEIMDIEPGCTIYYSNADISPQTKQGRIYTGPLVIRENTTLYAFAIDHNKNTSALVSASFYKIDAKRKINLKSEYANQYSAGGDNALIDYLRGGNNFRTGMWQGFREDLAAEIDLGEVVSIRKVSAGFLQDIKSWIWFPKEVVFSFSADGKSFSNAIRVKNDFPDDREGAFTKDFSASLPSGRVVRFIRVEAKNYGICPQWHLGAGGKTWLFADEIMIE